MPVFLSENFDSIAGALSEESARRSVNALREISLVGRMRAFAMGNAGKFQMFQLESRH